MNNPFSRIVRAALVFLFGVLHAAAFTQAHLEIISLMPAVITNPVLSQFDIFGAGLGATMFVVQLNNPTSSAISNLRLRYQVLLNYRGDGGMKDQLLYSGISDYFDLEPFESLLVPSNRFLNENSGEKIRIMHTEYELGDQPGDMALKGTMLTSQRVPDGTLIFSIELLGALPPQQWSGHYQVLNSNSIELVAPGADAGAPVMDIISPRPVFMWTSDLFPGIYGSENVFELRIYEAHAGESMGQALSRPPIRSLGVNAFQIVYPGEGRQLVQGAIYYWRVIGYIKGTQTSEITSPVFAFRLLPTADPRVLEVLNLLRLVLDESVIQQVYGYEKGVNLEINGEIVDVQRLRELVLQIQAGNLSVLDASVH